MDIETLKITSVIISLSAGLHGVILLLALNKLFVTKKVDRKWLLILVGGVTITSVSRVAHLVSETPDTKYLIFPDMILFFFGPCYYFFLKSVFSNEKRTFSLSSILLAFTPLYIHSIALIILFWSGADFIKNLVNQVYDSKLIFTSFVFILILGWIHNIYYWFKGNRLLQQLSSQFGDKKIKFSASFVQYFKWWYLIAIVLLGTVITIFAVSGKLNLIIYHITWIGISLGVYGIGYFLIYRPETFGDFLVDFIEKKPTSSKEKELIDKTAKKLKFALENDKIYLNPEISLLSLSSLLNINNVLLSKTINLHFQVGFYDLLNKYRVDEFIRLANLKDNERYTYYSLALEAGFNSKTSFNKYFKKFTHKTPREYFRK
ncbi:hypothetical protein BFP77_01840 [Maribacter sp. 4U21]|uniref:helix-turn-helix domain-containing protein n=1 Tax=Maribacter sp. 4U21 TaxID=1889779 RepID=UPI000C147583|nr:helix-turn-helix domain-containing protein [Maribacter sp. 4U21]PIB31334.1 hypothetical protein BFP77_01840 [Maribacter sp. 4U21]